MKTETGDAPSDKYLLFLAAGIESKCEDRELALEEFSREFEHRNHEIHEQWDGVSREANELLGPATAIETDNGSRWVPDAGE